LDIVYFVLFSYFEYLILQCKNASEIKVNKWTKVPNDWILVKLIEELSKKTIFITLYILF